MTTNKPLKICVLGYPGSPHIQNRTRALAELGHDVHLVHQHKADIPGVTSSIVAPRIPLPKMGMSIIPEYIAAIRRFNPDVIHVHYASGLHAWCTLLIDDIPVAVSLMGKDILFEEQGNPTSYSRRLTLDVIRRASLVTSKTEYMVRAAVGYAPDLEDRIDIIRWGVDTDRFQPLDTTRTRAELGIDDNDFIILCPRALAPIYNINTVVDAFALCLEHKPHAKLILFGAMQEPEYRAMIENKIDALAIRKKIVLLDNIPHPEMPAYLSVADVAISIPSSDGMPQTLFELMACGIPTIHSDLSQYREVADETCVIYSPIDAAEVSKAMVRLADDPTLRQSLGQAGMERARNVASFRNEVRRFDALLHERTAEKRRLEPYGAGRFWRRVVMHYLEGIAAGREI